MARPRKESGPDLIQPVTSEQLAPAVPAESQTLMASEKRILTIGLESLPNMEIEAESQAEAIKSYNDAMGIIATEHAYRVS